MPTGVYPRTIEHRLHQSLANKSQKPSKEASLQQSETRKARFADGSLTVWNKGRTGVYSPEQLRTFSESRRGIPSHRSEAGKASFYKKMSGHKINSGRHPTEETRRKLSVANKGKQNTLGHKLSEEHKKKIRDGNLLRWQDGIKRTKWLTAIFQSTHRRPTKPERLLTELLEAKFPGHFAYNGDFSQGVTLNRMVPDFININGEKSVIEVFGDAFHRPEVAWKPIGYRSTEKGRTEAYEELGYKCLIIWESDFKKPDAVVNKLSSFIEVGHDR